MNFFMATMAFIVALVAIIVLLPVANELLPFISESMGTSVAYMVSSMLVIIIVSAVLVWMKQSTGTGDTFGQGEYVEPRY